MPGLDLVAEDDAEGGVGGLDVRGDVGVEGVEEFFGELGGLEGRRRGRRGTYGTDVVEVDFEGVVGGERTALEDVSSEFRCDGHGCD